MEYVYKRNTNLSKRNRNMICNVAANIQYLLITLFDVVAENMR